MKTVKIITMLLLSFIVGSAIGNAAGVDALLMGGIGLASSFIPKGIDGLCADLYPEIWTGEMIKKNRDSDESIGWYQKIKDMSAAAKGKDVIHMIDLGADPDVLINNNTYPLDIQNLPDGDVKISLDKYQTLATRITDDELNNLPFDKIRSIVDRHKESILENKYKKAIHCIAPSENTNATPIVLTTGENGDLGKKLRKEDVLSIKKKFDKLKVPTVGRVLVLCSEHVNDLLETNQKFADQYHNYTTGKIANMFGFEVYEYASSPLYNPATLTKLPFGSTDENGKEASVAFHISRVVKADGDTKTYLTPATATTQEHLVSFRHYSITVPTKKEFLGAIVTASNSDTAAFSALGNEDFSLEFDAQVSVAKTPGNNVRTIASGPHDYVANVTQGQEWLTVAKNGAKITLTRTNNDTAAERTAIVNIALVENSDINKNMTVVQTA